MASECSQQILTGRKCLRQCHLDVESDEMDTDEDKSDNENGTLEQNLSSDE